MPSRWLPSLLVLLALSACTPPEHPLKVGSNQWPGYELVYLARELGALDPDLVKLVELPSSSDVMQHLRDGNLDAAMLTLDEAVTLLSEGLRLRAVLVMDVSNGADAVLARAPIAAPQDLRGRRIGVELSAVGAVMLESLLERAGLTPEDVEIVHLTVDQHLAAFQAGRIDAVVTFEPTRSRLLALGAREIFSSREIPGRIVDVLVVRRDAEDHHPQQIRAVVVVPFHGLAHLRRHPDTAYARIAPRLGVDLEQVRRAYRGLHLPDLEENRRWLGAPDPRLRHRAEALAVLMQRWRLIDHVPDLAPLPTDRYLPAP